MLRFKLDLSAFGSKFREPFWKLEQNIVPTNTVVGFLDTVLSHFGIKAAKTAVYLEGVLLPGSESVSIIRDSDLLKIVPQDYPIAEPQVVPRHENVIANHSYEESTTQNDIFTEVIRSPTRSDTGPSSSYAETYETCIDNTQGNRNAQQLASTKKRKRGKRPNRVRTKRVLFEESNGLGAENSVDMLQSTPFQFGQLAVSNSRDNASSSEMFQTAIDDHPGVSSVSKKIQKGDAKRLRKKASGLGYFLNLMKSDDSPSSSALLDTNVTTSIERSQSPHNPADDGDVTNQARDTSSLASESVKFDSLRPNQQILCEVGLFNLELMQMTYHTDVVLELKQIHPSKKHLTVTFVSGIVPSEYREGDFTVEWSLMKQVKIL